MITHGKIVALTVVCVLRLSAQVDQTLWRRAIEIHRTSIVMNAAVMTSQALIRPGHDIGKRWHGLAPGTGDLDLPRLREGGVNVLWEAVCGSSGEDESKIPFQGLELADTLRTDMLEKYPDDFELAWTVDDVRRIRAKGKIAVLLGMQAGQFINGSVRALRMFHRMGVQYMTLTHAWTDQLCDAAGGAMKWNGLSDAGRQVVREMGRLGMIPDISHATDKAAYQVLGMSAGPVIASHSNARKLCTPGLELARALGATAMDERNLSDDLMRRLAATCVNFAPALVSQAFADDYPRLRTEVAPALARHMKEFQAKYPGDVEKQREEQYRFLAERGIRCATYKDVVDHIEHVARVVGWDYVGIGSDWEGTGGYNPYHLEDVSKVPFLTYELLRRGHSEFEIRKFLGENMLRVLARAQETARRLQAGGRN